MKTITEEDAFYCAGIIESYFGQFNRIDEYMRAQKIQHLSEQPTPITETWENELFTDFLLHPKDMKLEIIEINPITWNKLLNITSSHINIATPGRTLKLAVIERLSGKYVGFIRISSPIINCKPRNDMLGQVFSQKPVWSEAFNNSAMRGYVIVPSQPFGFNYLGGKLLAGICCSHYVRRMINKKYDMNLCLFETTSLYGNTKSVSQYDGMKPYLRHKGNTESDFIPMINGKSFDDLRDYLESRVGCLVEYRSTTNKPTSSWKLKTIFKMIQIIQTGLKNHTTKLSEFKQTIQKAKKLTEQKRYYISNYGIKNYIDVVAGRTKTLVPDESYCKFELENIIAWWRNKAALRYETLVMDGRLKTELEVWNKNTNIEIIR